MKSSKVNKDYAHHCLAEACPEKPHYLPQERINLIEKEAYLVASARGFGNGDALSDWLTAEQRIDNGWTVE